MRAEVSDAFCPLLLPHLLHLRQSGIDWSHFWITLIGLPLQWVVLKRRTTVEVREERFLFFFFHHVGIEGSLLPSERSLQKCNLHLKKTKQSKKEYMLLCRSNSCLLFSLLVKTGKEALNSFHNPSTPFFLASNSICSHLCLWPSSQGTAVWWDLCSSTTQCLRYSCTQACGCILTYIGEHIKVIHAVLQACRGEITRSDRLFSTARTVAKMSQMNSKPHFWSVNCFWCK